MNKNDVNVSDTTNVKQLVSHFDNSLYADIKELIEETRFNVAQTVNTGIVVLYWNIGKKIDDDVLRNKRAEYGKQIVALISKQLTEEYGKGWSIKQIRHCLRFAETFPDLNNVVSLIRQLSLTHLIVLIPINVAEYITEILPEELLQKNAHTCYVESKNLIVDRG